MGVRHQQWKDPLLWSFFPWEILKNPSDGLVDPYSPYGAPNVSQEKHRLQSSQNYDKLNSAHAFTFNPTLFILHSALHCILQLSDLQ
jgi:hypothetical protein